MAYQNSASLRFARSLAPLQFPWALASGFILTLLCVLPISFVAWKTDGNWLSKPFYQSYIVVSWVLLLWRFARRSERSGELSGQSSEPELASRALSQVISVSLITLIFSQVCRFLLPWPSPSGSPGGSVSGHTAYAVALAWILALQYPRLAALWFGMAISVGWARIACNAHYPYQVFLGLILGTGIGWIVTERNFAVEGPLLERQARRKARSLSQGREESQYSATCWRLRLTGIGGIVMFLVAWHWGRANGFSWVFAAGILCALGGLLLRIWATGWLVKNQNLTTSGPYRLTRNPLYLGTMLIVLGQCLMSGVTWAPLVFPPFFLVLYWMTMRQEEKFLAERYGADYDRYAQAVPLFLPRLRNLRENSIACPEQTFSWQRVRRCYKGFSANLLLIVIYAYLYHAH